MTMTRPAAVAGAFYPAGAAALAAEVAEWLRGAGQSATDDRPPKAIIAPHAGYVYSAAIAASAYARIAPLRSRVTRVVLAGPAHRADVRGAAVPRAGAFRTPLGDVVIDEEALARLGRLPFVEASDAAHALEHALEVQLPFLQTVLGDFRLVPVVVGGASSAQVAQLLEEVWGGEETLVVVSSDLSHFLTYREAREKDRATADAIVALEPGLVGEQACGAAAVNGLLTVARHRGMAVELVDLRNSGDTAGGRDRVVGYGSFLFREREPADA